MNIKSLKWISALLPALCIGIFEFVRHHFMDDMYMGWGNLMVAGLTGVLFYLYSHGVSMVLENLYGKLQKEKEETAVLQERDRIAREIHDGISQALFFMNIKAREIGTALQQQRTPLAEIRELQEAIKLTDADVRKHIFALKRVAQDNMDLVAAIKARIDNYQQEYGAKVDFHMAGEINRKLNNQIKNKLIHVFQELLLNIRKHAGAEQVKVNLSENGRQFAMVISDNGQGFNTASIKNKQSSFGFKMLEDDVRAMGAELEVQSSPGRGTRVAVRLDLKEGGRTDGT